MTTRLLAEIRLTIDPRPAPRTRTSASTGARFNPRWYRELLDDLRWNIKAARVDPQPALGPVGLNVLFARTDARRGDLSNYIKAVEDAANGIVYVDDFQIREIRGRLELRAARPLIWARFLELSPLTATVQPDY